MQYLTEAAGGILLGGAWLLAGRGLGRRGSVSCYLDPVSESFLERGD